jgi:type VI secretion system protein ImpL
MKRILDFFKRIFFSRILLYIVGMLLAALLIWFIGPLIGIGGSSPLSTVLQRTLAITLLPAIMGLGATFSNARYARQNQQLQQNLTETPKAKAIAAGAEETADLGNRLKEALDLLKKTKVRRTWGSGWLYQLPWYIFIGPPGSGKTTALVNSGLNFPLAGQLGKKAVKGVGGTRSCDWWFTDDAVLIDTAGRYTTQDSDAAVDAAAWSGFLRLLKRYRKRQPINGAIVAIGISDLLAATEAQRLEHAQSIRARLMELYTELAVRFPVYVLFTKVDLISGFVEFFDDLGREGREQVWGMTFDVSKAGDETAVIDDYPGEFDALIGRMNQRLIERLQQEADIQRRALIFGFPQQIASLKEVTEGFLRAVFESNRYQKPARLRGIYFTSGTQDGTPIDRLMGSIAASFGISRQQVSAFSGTGRSYFLMRLMRNVIFGEASLVSADAKVERRARFFHYGVLGAAAMIVVLVTAGWTAAYINNSELIQQIEQQAAAVGAHSKGVTLDKVADSDLRPVLPLLAALRDMPGGYSRRNETSPLLMQLGLYQGDKLNSQAIAVYRRDLNRILLPRMLIRLEAQLAKNQDRPDFLYEALKVYLMLGQQGKLDKSLVARWMALDWRAQFPGPENEDNVKALRGHLDALLEKPLTSYALNGPLVEQARAVLLRVPLAEHVYSLIKTHPKITALPEWRVSEHAGPAVGRALVRTSGRSLAEGIPGLYTHDGYFFGFRPLLPEAAKETARESWVLGQQAKIPDDPASVLRLERDVTSIYLKDFEDQWDRLLADIAIKPFTSMGDAAQTLNVLAAPDSPLRALMLGAANETWLSRVPTQQDSGPSGLNEAAAAAARVAEQRASRSVPAGGRTLAEQQLGTVLGSQNAPNDDIAGPETDRHFKGLHSLAGADGKAPAPIDGAIAGLNDLYLQINRLTSSGDPAKALAESGGTAKLQADAARMAEPMQTMVLSVTRQVAALTVGGAHAQLNALWTASVVPFCESALQNRYPAFRTASNEITLDDFSRLFSRGGLIDAFFTSNLRQYVDISKNPWVSLKVDNVDLGIPSAILAQFQRAASIRDNMFTGGGTKPGVSFEVLPISLDSKSTQVALEIDGQTMTYDHGPPRAVKMMWPGPSGVGHVRIAFQPQSPGEPAIIESDGAWAWFRVLQSSQLKQSTGADRFVVTFKVADRSASFEIRANSVINPFASNQLEAFRCPPKL